MRGSEPPVSEAAHERLLEAQEQVARLGLVEEPLDGLALGDSAHAPVLGELVELERLHERRELLVRAVADPEGLVRRPRRRLGGEREGGHCQHQHGQHGGARGRRGARALLGATRGRRCAYTYCTCIQSVPSTQVFKMARRDKDDPDELAPLFEAFAHPFRVAILNELRAEPKMSVMELRKRVAANYEAIDTRNIQFHLFRMQIAGVVRVAREEGRDVVTLLKNVELTIRIV